MTTKRTTNVLKFMDAHPRTAAELTLLARRAMQVWPFVAVGDRLALGTAALITAVTSAANTGGAILLGQLVDRIQTGARSQFGHWHGEGRKHGPAGYGWTTDQRH